MHELCALITRHCHSDFTATGLARLVLSRSLVTTKPVAAIYHPLLCVVACGRKRIFLGDEVLNYDPATYLVSSVDLPVTGQVIEAPSLGLTLMLDPRILATLLLDMPPTAAGQGASKAMEVNALGADLLDPILRLLRLLDEPEHIPALARSSSARSTTGCCSETGAPCCANRRGPPASCRRSAERST